MALKPVRRGEQISQRRYNQTQDAIPQNISGTGGVNVHHSGKDLTIRLDDDRIIPASGSGGGGGMTEFRIVRVLAEFSDISTPEELLIFGEPGNVGPHIHAVTVNAGGFPDMESYVVVFPNREHTLSEFKSGNEHFYDIDDPSDPIYQAYSGNRGLTMILGEGATWDTPPTPDEICGFGDLPEGACCLPDESCVMANEANCAQAEGLFRGEGTDCGTEDCTEGGGGGSTIGGVPPGTIGERPGPRPGGG